jgi:hypothetical protein
VSQLFLVTVKVVCGCGWLMQQWDVDFLCGNPRCANNGKTFKLEASLGQFKLAEKVQ